MPRPNSRRLSWRRRNPVRVCGQPPRRTADEERAITAAPGTTGINLDVLRPYVFAPSVVDKLMVDMPMVASGTYASGTITTAATAAAVPKGGSGTTGDVPETAAAFTVQTTTPHRIGASLNLAIEDVAAVGQDNFESLLRQHISLAVSDQLDNQMLNGEGASDDLTGVFERLTAGSAPAAAVETWTRFLAIQSGGIDGLWSSELAEIGLLVGPETYRLAAATFQGTDSEESAASYLKRMGAGFETNKRMPDKETHIQEGILTRRGRRTMPTPMRTAVCPHWGYFTIDDIYHRRAQGAAAIRHQYAGGRRVPRPAGRLRSSALPRFGLTERAGFFLGCPLVAAGRLVAWLPPGRPAATASR